MDTPAHRTIREKLIAVAQRRETIPYSAVGALVDLPAHSRPLFTILDDINRHEHAAGRPLLTAIVVNKEEGMSGHGFFKLAAQLGHHRDGDDDRLYWEWERDRVYAEWASAR